MNQTAEVNQGELVPVQIADHVPAVMGQANAKAEDIFQRGGLAKQTRRAYESDFRHFTNWCATRDACPLPATPQTVGLYLADISDTFKLSTLIRRAAAISTVHKDHGFESPTDAQRVREFMKALKRAKQWGTTKKAPVLRQDLRAMVAACGDGMAGARNRAILLVGFYSALRRESIAAITVENLSELKDGVVIHISTEKTDQEGRGRDIGLRRMKDQALCPVAALRAWMDAAEIKEGLVFRQIDRRGRVFGSITGKSIAAIVKTTAKAAGLDPAKIGGHSLRSGFTTQASKDGVPYHLIKRQTGHKSDSVLQGYIRLGDILQDNAMNQMDGGE